MACVTFAAPGCGVDAEQRFAGMAVVRPMTATGVTYRMRYLDPPWEQVDDDPLVSGKLPSVSVGGVQRTFEPGTAVVLEIERDSIVTGGDSYRLPKYRAEAMVLSCSSLTRETCAEQLALEDEMAREAGKDEQTGLFAPSPRVSTNDFGQRYFELLTKDLQTLRYRRIAFFETDNPSHAVRVFLEANPRLDETEITKMLDAFETETPAGLAARDGGP